jgi:hypothetical protein
MKRRQFQPTIALDDVRRFDPAGVETVVVARPAMPLPGAVATRGGGARRPPSSTVTGEVSANAFENRDIDQAAAAVVSEC